MVIIFQTTSFIIVALSENVTVGIIGVVFASFGAGLGEISYLSLASNFNRYKKFNAFRGKKFFYRVCEKKRNFAFF